MTQHVGTVIAVQNPRSIPDEDGKQAIEVLLAGGTSIYLKLGSPEPPLGATLTWQGGRAWWGDVIAEKVGYSFGSGKSVGGALY